MATDQTPMPTTEADQASGKAGVSMPGWWLWFVQYWPGTLLCGLIAVTANTMAHLHNGPPLLYALLFGLSFNFLSEDPKTRLGIDFCGRTLLRIGVALLGARITVMEITSLGWDTVGIIVAAVITTIGVGAVLAMSLRMTVSQGVLSGGATAICGASAALAISAVLPRSREQERFTLIVVVTVSSLSTVAMVLHPILAHTLELTSHQAALMIGGTIHDVAQVIGAGYSVGPDVGDQATVVKLLRVSLLAVVVLAVSWLPFVRRERNSGTGSRPSLLPLFLIGFFVLVGVNSLGFIPNHWTPTLNDASRMAFTIAIAALGIRSSWQALMKAGWRAFALLLLETAWLTSCVLTGAVLMKR